MKGCIKCGEVKELNEFYKNSTKYGDGRSSTCRECEKSYKKEHYKNNKEKYKKNYLKHRKWFINLKSSLKCEKCGYDKSGAALDFHHKDPTIKLFSVSGKNLSGKSREEIYKEIKKCNVWCSNCHREHHSHY